MRSFLAGLILLVISTSALAQVTGHVESIGFQSVYRPDCWTPMVVQLKSDIAEPANYQIRVYQLDLDKDYPVFVKDVTLGGKQTERYWTYFLPQPLGLPDATSNSAQAAKELEQALRVKLFTTNGKQVGPPLSISFSILNLDPRRNYMSASRRGSKMILYVNSGGSRPSWKDYQLAKGISEEVEMISARPSDLPEDVRGYEAIDGIIWLDANADELSAGGSRVLPALQEYVRHGGRMVICQPAEKFKIEALADMCPVVMKDAADNWVLDVRDRRDLDVLAKLAKPPDSRFLRIEDRSQEGWKRLEKRGPFKVAYAKPKPNAMVDVQLDWSQDPANPDKTPYLARMPYGLGSVTWVAQDLGNPSLSGADASGWPYIWDKVFGWSQRTLVLREGQDPERQAELAFQPDDTVDIGPSLLSGMEHTSRAGYYIFLAVIFFVAYWVVAGPGSYFFLASKGRKEISWMIYGACALGATALTVLVVRLVLRGAPEAHHITVVRAALLPSAGGAPKWHAVADSRIGLYIPSDGMQEVSLKDNQPGVVSYISPFAIPPQYIGEQGWADGQSYDVFLRDATATEPVSVQFPYRSTLKKIQARWVGSFEGGIGGSAKLADTSRKVIRNGKSEDFGSRIDGQLVNNTGRDLRNVYLAFSYPDAVEQQLTRDWVLFIPRWGNSKTLDLASEFIAAKNISVDSGTIPGRDYNVKGELGGRGQGWDWDSYWYSAFGGNAMSNERYDDSDQAVRRSFPMMALFNRLRPHREKSPGAARRVEIVRRGGRQLDMSDQVAAGQLVVLAQTDKEVPLPFPLEVRGDPTPGTGTTLYEFTLPLDRAELAAAEVPAVPATQPASTRQTAGGAEPVELQ